MTMDELWAPWRSRYIKKIKKEKGCLFCRVFKSKNDKKNFVVLRFLHSFAMLNLYPYNAGHIMVSPVRHVRSLELLNETETRDLLNMVKRVKLLLDRVLKPQGYNIGININRIAGAGFDQHLHVHIVPRWSGDTNFMPVLFNTKIISQSLEGLYKELTQGNK